MLSNLWDSNPMKKTDLFDLIKMNTISFKASMVNPIGFHLGMAQG